MMAEAWSRSLEDGLSQKVLKHLSQTRVSLRTIKREQTKRWRLTRWMLGMEEVFQWTVWSSSCEKTSKFQILNISFWTMDLESVIIDYLTWVESYTVYVVWIHNIAHQAKKMLLRVWKDVKSIKLHAKVLHLIRSSQIEYKVMKGRNCVCCVVK